MPGKAGNVWRGDAIEDANREAKKAGTAYIPPTPKSLIKQRAITSDTPDVNSKSLAEKARDISDNFSKENGFNAAEIREQVKKFDDKETDTVELSPNLTTPEEALKTLSTDTSSIVPEPIVPSLSGIDMELKTATTPDITKEHVTNKNIQSAVPVQDDKPQKTSSIGTPQDALRELSDVGAEIQRQAERQENTDRESGRQQSARSQPPPILSGMDQEIKTILMGQTEYLALIVELLGTMSDKLDIEEPES